MARPDQKRQVPMSGCVEQVREHFRKGEPADTCSCLRITVVQMITSVQVI